MSIAHIIKTLIRNLKLGLRARHISRSPRSYTTPAQIQAFCEARFDRWAFEAFEAPEMWLAEPGLKSKDPGHLDLTSNPDISWSESVDHVNTRLERRKGSRYRDGT